MKNIQNKTKLKIMIFVLISVIILGVGYATLTAINLIISGNAGGRTKELNYEVKFMSVEGVTPQFHSDYEGVSGTATVTSDTTATFSVTGFTVEGQTATAKYKVKNSSTGVGTRISLNLEYTNTEYFKVREYIEDTELKAGEETEVTVTVELYQLPLESNTTVTTSINARLIAEPINNGSATGNTGAVEGQLSTKYKYSISQNTIGNEWGEWSGEQPSYEAAKIEFGHPTAIAHIIKNGHIDSSYVVFEYNNEIHHIRGGVNESDQVNKPVYDTDVSELKTIFGGEGVWQSYCNMNEYDTFSCRFNGLIISVSPYGITELFEDNGHFSCDIDNNGYSRCREF